MRTIGIMTTTVACAAAAVAVALGVRSIPDLKRYLRIKRM
ncbi:MAG: DUF6893 family small protein [Nocardioidaceae bacterium]